jgi:4-amino-4-deoxy-L-arabinose transferase-like glycosyltransferase
MSIWPLVNEYFKTNYFLAVFLVVLILLSLYKYTPLAGKLKLKWPLATLLLIVLSGFVLRVGWISFSSHEIKFTRGHENVKENDLINIHAVELTEGKWFLNEDGTSSGRRPIGYPVFLGLIYKLFGVQLKYVWISNLAFYALTAALIYAMGCCIFSSRVALIATFLFTIYPISVYSVNMTTDENLFLPLWYLGLYLIFCEVRGQPIRRNWVLYGIIFGYTTMTRTHSIFMPLIIGLMYFLKKMRWKKIILATLTVAMMMQLLNVPWIIRNYKAWGVPVLYGANFHYVYSHFNSTASIEGWGHIPRKGEPGYSEELEAAMATRNEGLMHRQAKKEMIRWIITHPSTFLVMGSGRLLHFMNWNRKGGVWPIWYQYSDSKEFYDSGQPLPGSPISVLEEIAFLAYYLIFHISLLSIILLVRRWRTFDRAKKNSLIILCACFAFYFLEHMVIFSHRKYRFPLEPLMILIASYAIDYVMIEFRWEKITSPLQRITK